MDVSIIIPTLNRSDHIIKMIRYFNIADFQGHLLIGDSSTTEHIERTKAVIKELNPKFTILYREYPQRKNFECVRYLLQEVVTPYVIWGADDDVLIPSTLARAADFLDQNPDYSGVGGMAIRYQLKNLGAYGEISDAERYLVSAAEKKSSSERVLHLLQNYTVVLLSIQRTKQLKEQFRKAEVITDLTFASELLPACMVVAQGKIKLLNQLFIVRQIQKNNYALPDVFDWITKPDWPSSYQIFAKTLAQALVAQDAISFEKAMGIVKQAFWRYLSKSLNLKFQQHYQVSQSPNICGRAKNAMKNTPGVMRFWHIIQSFQTNSISLPSLLNPRSPYHNDFMPVYRATVSPPPEINF